MKKILVTLLFLLSSLVSYGQLNKTDVSEYYRHMQVVDFGKNTGLIEYTEEGFILYGVSNVFIETCYHSIFLGKTKESAITSLNELECLDRTKAYLVKGELEFKTLIYSFKNKTIIVTDGVQGSSSILNELDGISYKRTKKAIEAFSVPVWDD